MENLIKKTSDFGPMRPVEICPLDTLTITSDVLYTLSKLAAEDFPFGLAVVLGRSRPFPLTTGVFLLEFLNNPLP